MGNLLFELTIIISLAAILSILLKLIKQPPILAYILTGIIIGPFGNLQLQSRDFLQALGEFGIALLLFIIGLELNFSEIKSVSKVSAAIGTLQVVITGVGGYFASTILGFSHVTSLYLGAALSFSSTIIVVKLLSDIKALQTLYGKISVGLLLVQDFFAIIVLIFLSSFLKDSLLSFENVGSVFLEAIVIILLVFILSVKVFPKLIQKIATSSETLFLFSLAWVLGISALISAIGFSIEIGGLLAGFSLANATDAKEIIQRAKSLRDFFTTLFFVILGLNMTFYSFPKIFFSAIILSVLVLIFKPLITALIMKLMGFPKRIAMLTGISLGQISEFSLIIVFLGQKLGQISVEIVSLVATIAVITFAVSSYLIVSSGKLTKSLG